MNTNNTFRIMYTYDVANDESWDDAYTALRSQHSDSGEFIWVVGYYEDAVETFATSAEMFEWCYLNGWTKQEGA